MEPWFYNFLLYRIQLDSYYQTKILIIKTNQWLSLHFYLIIVSSFNGRLKKWGEKNGLWWKSLYMSICRNRTTASKMLTYLLDKMEHSSLPLSFKTLNIWIDVLWQETHPDLGHVSNLEWWKPLRFRGETICVWKFPLGFHLWHPQSFWALQMQIKQQVLFIQTQWMAPTHTARPPRSFHHTLLFEDISADFSNFLSLPVTTFDWLHQLQNVQLLCGAIKVVPHKYRKCGGFYRHPFLLHKQRPNDTHQAETVGHMWDKDIREELPFFQHCTAWVLSIGLVMRSITQ